LKTSGTTQKPGLENPEFRPWYEITILYKQ
jgi:hypothetical protein